MAQSTHKYVMPKKARQEIIGVSAAAAVMFALGALNVVPVELGVAVGLFILGLVGVLIVGGIIRRNNTTLSADTNPAEFSARVWMKKPGKGPWKGKLDYTDNVLDGRDISEINVEKINGYSTLVILMSKKPKKFYCPQRIAKTDAMRELFQTIINSPKAKLSENQIAVLKDFLN